MNLVAPVAFAGFVALGLLAARGRRWTHAFLIYAVLLSSTPGLLQLDAWPFSAWPLVAGIAPSRMTFLRPMGVDDRGDEHEIDYRAWQPFPYGELHSWLDARLPALPEAEQRRAAAFLLDLAEAGRRRARAGEPVGRAGVWLGPFVAPYFVLHPARWRSAADAPERPFVGLRIYAESWTIGERLRAGEVPARRLRFEYRRP